jgi:hypothetical protein
LTGALVAAALARCIDDTHATAAGLSGKEAACEAALVRASATRALATLGPAVTTMLEHARQQPPGHEQS